MDDLNSIVTSYLEEASARCDARRRHERFRFEAPLPAQLGRAACSILDISAGGARVEHSLAVDRAARPHLRFQWRGEKFDSPVHILSSRLVAITGRRRIITRLVFRNPSAPAAAILHRLIDALNDERILQWTANLHGTADAQPAHDPVPAQWLLYEERAGRWEGTVFRAEQLPRTGFVVPDTIPPAELREICTIFPQLDADSQELLRRCLLAAGGKSGSRLR